jgi:hypothetical protein
VTPAPSLAEIETIGADADPVRRNVRITQAYELSTAVAGSIGPAANWCTFATWASRQAGQTIRREDLARTIEAELDAEELAAAVTRISEFLRRVGRRADRSRILAAVREAVSPVRAVERTSEAVARGNKKVFDEIGRAFARFVAALAGPPGSGPAPAHAVLSELRPGPPPDGQDLLGAAFLAYQRAMTAGDGAARAQLVLLANLRIGRHEQTRLQPDIVAALEAPVAGPQELKERLLRRLVPQGGFVLGMRQAGEVGRPGLLDEVVDELRARVRARIRAVVTAHLMTLHLPQGRVRLGTDLPGACPPDLLHPTDPELKALLDHVDPVPLGGTGSGAEDWGDLPQRMHFIAELFRSRQDDRSLFSPPFMPDQAAAIREGRLPAGRL